MNLTQQKINAPNLIFGLLLLCFNCTQKQQLSKEAPQWEIADGAALHKTAARNSPVLKQLHRKEDLIVTEMVSPFVESLPGQMALPWVLVALKKEGIEGWVHASKLYSPVSTSATSLQRSKLLLASYFGLDVAHQVEAYNKVYKTAKTDAELATALLFGDSLSMLITAQLNQRAKLGTDSAGIDLRWLPLCFSGFSKPVQDENNVWGFFRNFNALARKNQSFEGAHKYAALLSFCYGDSTAWFTQKWFIRPDQQSFNTLGDSAQLLALQQMEQMAVAHPSFAALLKKVRMQLLSELTRPNQQFWHNKTDALRELKKIKNLPSLGRTDKVALEVLQGQILSGQIKCAAREGGLE